MMQSVTSLSSSIQNIVTPNHTSEFKQKYTLETRKMEAKKIKNKYPDRVPVIVEMSDPESKIKIDKNKYLVPSDLTVSQFIFVLRRRLKLKPEEAIYLFFGDGILVNCSEIMLNVYEKYKDNCSFLYVTISFENTFGSIVSIKKKI